MDIRKGYYKQELKLYLQDYALKPIGDDGGSVPTPGFQNTSSSDPSTQVTTCTTDLIGIIMAYLTYGRCELGLILIYFVDRQISSQNLTSFFNFAAT